MLACALVSGVWAKMARSYWASCVAVRLLSSTFRRSGKAKELADNGRVEVCFLDGRKYQLRVEGLAGVSGGPEKKRELLALNPGIRKHFKDEFNPEFVLIESRHAEERSPA